MSATPVWKKLGLSADKDGTLVLIGSPTAFELPDLPAGITVRRQAKVVARKSQVDVPATTVEIAFFREQASLRRVSGMLPSRIWPYGSLWIAWPRRAGGHTSDITDNIVRECLLPHGIVDIKVAAIDGDWSGLRFVWRKERRPPA